MTAFTSKAAGNWSASGQTTWNEAGVPGNGDTATLTHAIAVDTNTTVGTSGAAGTIDVIVDKTGSNAGALTINAGVTLTVRGDLQLKNALLTLAAGASYVFDSSLATGTPVYKIVIGAGGANNFGDITCNGSSGSHCSFSKAVGSGNGCIRSSADATSVYTSLHTTYTDFSDLGAASFGISNDAVFVNVNSSKEFYVHNCTFTRCGRIFINSCKADGDIDVQYSRTSGNIGTYGFWVTATAATTGKRLIQDCVFSDLTSPLVFKTSVAGFTFSRNVCGVITYTSLATTAAMTECADNLLIVHSKHYVTGNNLGEPGGTVARTYVCYEVSAPAAADDNVGIVPLAFSTTGTITYEGFIYETTKGDENDDAIKCGVPTAAETYQINHLLVLPNSRGLMSGAITAHGNANTTLQVNHCTLMAGEKSPSDSGYSGCIVGSSYAGFAGMVNQFQDNLIWCPDATASDRYSLRTINATPAADIVTTANCTNNAHYQISNGTVYDQTGANGQSELGYHNFRQTSRPLGANDVSLSSAPGFVDTTRNLATWDIAFLGNAAGTAWADAHSYSVGDVVSAADAGFYGGATINYCCVTAHTSSAGNATNGQPGVATNWMTNWELQSSARMRTAVLAGTTYTVNGTSYAATRALYEWVRAGFSPNNAALHAGHDGSWIGAVDGASIIGPIIGPGKIIDTYGGPLMGGRLARC